MFWRWRRVASISRGATPSTSGTGQSSGLAVSSFRRWPRSWSRGMSVPCRILRVIPRYAPAWRYGGSVRFSVDLDTALANRGFTITVYTSDQIDHHERSPLRFERIGNIDVHRFPNPFNYVASQAAWLGLYPIGLRRTLMETVGR